MALRNTRRDFAPIVLVFVMITALAIVFRSRSVAWNLDSDVVIFGNLFLFLVTLFSFFIAKKGLQAKSPHAFMRSVYGSIMIKLFICMIAAFIYISMNKAELNKPALFTCMGLYLVYTFMEVAVLMKQLREKKHG